uniref:N-acetylneuraminic acid phosphatase n=1 Tax=Oryzias latipes TaxID=8090 RepID=A0A3P9HRC4_ORYLA
MAGQTVGAILFDLDNTLIETTKAGGVAIQKTSELLRTALGLNDATISSICNKFKQKLLQENFDPLSVRSLDDTRVRHWEESIEETLGSLPRCSLGAECYYLWKKSRLDALSLSPEVRDLLRRLRCRYKLLLLTNGEARSQQEKVDAVQCQEFFDAIVIGGGARGAETLRLHLHAVFQQARRGGAGVRDGGGLSGHGHSGGA